MKVKELAGPEIVFDKTAEYVATHKYEILLLSFLFLIFGDTFNSNLRLLQIFNIYQNIITGLVVFYNHKALRFIIYGLLLFSLSLEIYQSVHAFAQSRSLHSIIYLVFFSLVSMEVFKALLYSKTVSRELLSAAMCGFVLLCMISTFLFLEIEASYPNSFSNIGTGKDTLSNLNYFSFVTILTIGYGDILPLTLVAKRMVMFMALAGHFYTVFITSIIIGKYLSSKKP